MKKLTMLLFSVLISFNSYGEWTELGNGTDHYIDEDTIKEHNGYVYYWMLGNHSLPSTGYESAKLYLQGDCGVVRLKILSMIAFTQSLANGNKEEQGGSDAWIYPTPSSRFLNSLNYACNYVK
jgi:hypothetical protein